MKKLIKIKIINNNIYDRFNLPQYTTPGSAGLDLLACIDRPIDIYPERTYLISTGIAIHIDDAKIAGIILPRSGLGHNHGIVLGNSVGLLDSDYQGELMISLWNRDKNKFLLTPGKRIAQILFISVIQIQFMIVKSFVPTQRGIKGFGHSL